MIIRLSYAADLPDPAQLLKTLKDMPADAGASSSQLSAPSSGASGAGSSSHTRGASGGAPESVHAPIEAPRSPRGDGPRAALAVVPEPEIKPIVAIKTLEDLVVMLEQHDEYLLASNIYQYAHLVKLEEGLIEIRPEEEAPQKLTQDLGSVLRNITGNRWMVSVSSAPGQPTLAEKDKANIAAEREEILNMPIIRDIIQAFPEAGIKAIHTISENEE